jgi:hypothetical protein
MSFYTCVYCYVHSCMCMSISPGMSCACIHLGVHDHHVSNATHFESLDVDYWCVANEV